jgi:phospholipase/carboxylesterase
MSSAADIFAPLLKQTFASPLDYEFWPALDTSSQKLMLVLHGRGDSMEGFHWLPSALDVESMNFLFLEAPDEYGPGYSWYDTSPNQAPGILRSRTYLFQLLNELQSVLGLKAENIFILGFSQGSLMCVDLALRYPKVLAGAICISGYVFFEDEYPAAFSSVAKQQRLWISHGYQDSALPIDRSAKSVERLRSLGLTIDWNPLNKDHTVDEHEEIPLIREFLTTHLEAN